MKRLIAASIAFVITLALCAGLMWVGGFDFDQRNVGVAYFTLMSFIVSGFVAYFTWEQIP